MSNKRAFEDGTYYRDETGWRAEVRWFDESGRRRTKKKRAGTKKEASEKLRDLQRWPTTHSLEADGALSLTDASQARRAMPRLPAERWRGVVSPS